MAFPERSAYLPISPELFTRFEEQRKAENMQAEQYLRFLLDLPARYRQLEQILDGSSPSPTSSVGSSSSAGYATPPSSLPLSTPPSPSPSSSSPFFPSSSTGSLSSSGLEIIEIGESQYSMGSVSSCGIAAVEVGFGLMCRNKHRTAETIREALVVASAYNREDHIDPEDILQLIPRYKQYLRIAHDETLLSRGLNDHLTGLLEQAPEETHHLLLVGLGTTIFLSVGVAGWLVFDSHSRPNHAGAAFLSSSTFAELTTLLLSLFPVPSLADSALSVFEETAQQVRVIKLAVASLPADPDAIPPLDISVLPVHTPFVYIPPESTEEEDRALALRLQQEDQELARSLQMQQHFQPQRPPGYVIQQHFPYPQYRWQ